MGVLLALGGPLSTSLLAQSGAVDDLLHGYPGTLLGPTTFSTASRSGNAGDYCIDFTTKGGSGIVISNAQWLNFATSNDVLSVSFWQKRYDINPSTGSSAFWGVSPSSSGTERGFQAHTPWSNDNIYFDTAGCCDGSLQRISAAITGFQPYIDFGSTDDWWTNWHHFVFFKNLSDKQIWIDGQLFLDGTSTSPLPSDFTDFWLGNLMDASGPMHARMDDFAFYSTALSANSIGLLYSGTSPTNLPGEVVMAYWSFDNPPLIGALDGNCNGLSYLLYTSSTRAPDTSSIVLTLDGQNVTPSSLATNGITITVNYVLPNPPLLPGSTHTASLTIKDTKGNSYSSSGSFAVQQFTLVSTNQLLAASAATLRGFKEETYQVDDVVAGNMATANAVLKGAYGPNVANTNADPLLGSVGPDGFFVWTNVVNFDITPTASDGDFNAPDYPDFYFPGIPGNPVTYVNTENFVCQFYTALSFPSNGLYTMDVNSDDGFRVSLGMNPFDAFGSYILGQYDGTRGWADTTFQFYIPKPGLYPFRLLYQQVGGGANLEWFMINADGTDVLINDITNAIAAYQWLPSFSAAYVSSITPPANDSTAAPNLISAVITDVANPVDPSTVKLQIDGTAVTAKVSKTNGQTTVSYVPSPVFAALSQHTATVSFKDGTNSPSYNWSFTVAVYSLDKPHKYIALLTGTAAYTPNQGGHSGKAGDYAIDFGTGGPPG